jgi:ubiquinone/menaquinone biosynthesis C-methylase UbiE
VVSIAQTRKKYHGRKAETYEEVRTKQQRWDEENVAVEKLLRDVASTRSVVLDCPMGTGRFITTYRKLGVKSVIGIDVSESMLKFARFNLKKRWPKGPVKLVVGDAEFTDLDDKSVDATVCVRFLDLIDDIAMRSVLEEMCRVTRHSVILTIRLGEKYVAKSNTATHDAKKFWALVNRLGFSVIDTVGIFNEGWIVARIERDKK